MASTSAHSLRPRTEPNSTKVPLEPLQPILDPVRMPVEPLHPILLFSWNVQISQWSPEERRPSNSPELIAYFLWLMVIGCLLWLWVVSFHFYLSCSWITQWCSGCRDGGDLIVCMIFNINALCSLCINFGNKDNIVSFQCPSCFKKPGKHVPYVCFCFNFILTNIYVDIALEISILWFC